MDPPIFVERAEPSPFLKGVVDVPPGHQGALRVMLVEGGAMLAWTVATGEGRRRAFALRLPAEVCDGRPHAFAVMVDEAVVARLATITPITLTPAATLQDYAGKGLRGRLSVVAAHRYAALAERLAEAPDAATAANSAVAHRFLTEGAARVGLTRSYLPLALPVSDAPQVSIVIPVHNKFDYTYRCLAALALMPVATPFEVVLVDDGSTDQTVDLAALVRGVRVVRHEQARGFVHACNAGAAAARGAFVLLLNNDTEVSPHWLDRLVEPFVLFDDVGLVGGETRLSAMAAFRRRAESSGTTGRHGTMAGSATLVTRGTISCARRIIVRARASSCRPRCGASWTGSTRRSLPLIMKTPISPSASAPRAGASCTSRSPKSSTSKASRTAST